MNTILRPFRYLRANPAVLGYLVLFIVVVVGFVRQEATISAQDEIIADLEDVDQRLEAEGEARTESANDFFQAIVDSQFKECRVDHAYRVQYQIRGQALEDLIKLFIGLAQENVAKHKGEAISEAFIKQFQPFLNRIEILPTPNCRDQKEKLEEYLPFPTADPAQVPK